MHIGIAADYGRYELKEQLAMKLRARGFEVEAVSVTLVLGIGFETLEQVHD